MAKCVWSKVGYCQCFLNKETGEHPVCDGEHNMPCRQGVLDLVDIRDLGGLPIKEETEQEFEQKLHERIAQAPAPAPTEEPQPKGNPGRGGKRAGAGAPVNNLNAIKSGAYSKQMKDAYLAQTRILKKTRAAREHRAAEQPAAQDR